MKSIYHFAALCVATILTLMALPAHGTIINAASILLTDVSNAVAIATGGDTISLPAGTNIWTGQLKITKPILFKGAGTNTVIVDEVPRGGSGVPMISITLPTNGFVHLMQFTIRAGVTNTGYNYHGAIELIGGAPASWRIDHVKFDAPYAKAIISYGLANAVVDHCTFLMRAEGVIGYGDGYGDTSWATPVNWGGSNMLYIEDCMFTNIIGAPAAVFDGYAGARVVFRHNVVLNDIFANHGTESSQRYRSTRAMEVYNNTFIDNQNYTWPIMSRGGSCVIFSNTAVGFNNFCGFFNYRNTDPFQPWSGVTGINPWDSNDPTLYLSGTHGGANNSTTLVVSGANWTANQWVGYTVNNTNSGRFSIITGNTANTISTHSPKDLSAMTFNTGDHFTIYKCIYALDQVGRGSGDLVQGDGPPYGWIANLATGQANWPRESAEPCYVWGNTLNGNVGTANNSGYPNIQENRDFFNNTAKPGYTPYVYPHPLTGMTNSSGSNTNSNGGGGTTNNAWPSPPTGLKVINHTP